MRTGRRGFLRLALVATIATTLGPRAATADASSWTLVDVAVDFGRVGEAYSGVVRPAVPGAYWFEIRQPLPPGTPYPYIPPADPARSSDLLGREASGALFRARVIEADSGRELEPDSGWTRFEESTSDGGRARGIMLAFTLRAGVAYRVSLSVAEAAPEPRPLGLRFVFEASNAARNNATGAAAVRGAAILLATLAILGALALVVLARGRRPRRGP